MERGQEQTRQSMATGVARGQEQTRQSWATGVARGTGLLHEEIYAG
jgi:hypothetical protein